MLTESDRRKACRGLHLGVHAVLQKYTRLRAITLKQEGRCA